jgi:hypothetical protein
MKAPAIRLGHDKACPEHQRWLDEVEFRVKQNESMAREIGALAENNDRLSAKVRSALILLAEIVGAGGIASEEQLEQIKRLIQ